MANAIYPTPFVTGPRLIDGSDLNNQLAKPVVSSQNTLTATPSGTATTSLALVARYSRISTVATAGDGVRLITAEAGKSMIVVNDATNSMKVFARGTNTINGTAGATGISLAGKSIGFFSCPGDGLWYAIIQPQSATGGFTIAASNTGTFTATGATEVVVANTNITANSVVMFGLKTAAGTIAGAPFMSSVTAGTSFGVKAGASDTSVYNYAIIG